MKEIFSTTAVECRGREAQPTGHTKGLRYLPVLKEPIQALITTFSDATRDVCCPLLTFGENCTAGKGMGEANMRYYPSCVFVTGIENRFETIGPGHPFIDSPVNRKPTAETKTKKEKFTPKVVK